MKKLKLNNIYGRELDKLQLENICGGDSKGCSCGCKGTSDATNMAGTMTEDNFFGLCTFCQEQTID